MIMRWKQRPTPSGTLGFPKAVVGRECEAEEEEEDEEEEQRRAETSWWCASTCSGVWIVKVGSSSRELRP